jgi:hypothetical protein
MRVSVRLVVALVCCMFAHYHAASAQAQYLNPKLVEKKITITNAVILPAKVEITKESAKGSEMMVAESADISVNVTAAVGRALQEKKIGVVMNFFEPTAMDEGQKYKLADIQSRYDALLPKLMDKSKDIKKARFTLSDEVMLLNVDKSADALVFIRGQGRVFTKGKTAFSLINIFSFDFPLAQITVGIVDARTGEVLVFTKPLSASKVLKDQKALNKMIEKSLKKLPAATPAKSTDTSLTSAPSVG